MIEKSFQSKVSIKSNEKPAIFEISLRSVGRKLKIANVRNKLTGWLRIATSAKLGVRGL